MLFAQEDALSLELKQFPISAINVKFRQSYRVSGTRRRRIGGDKVPGGRGGSGKERVPSLVSFRHLLVCTLKFLELYAGNGRSHGLCYLCSASQLSSKKHTHLLSSGVGVRLLALKPSK